METLPFGSEFSPNQIELPTLLDICMEHSGDVVDLDSAILKRFFSKHGHGSERNQRKLAMNCRLGLKNYGILDETWNFTPLGQVLFSLKSQPDKLYEAFAKHILLHLNGMGFVQCILDMWSSLQKITLETLKPELEARGITYPFGGKHPSVMRLWLEKAGVFHPSKKWRINEDRLYEVLGSDENDMTPLRSFTKQQRYFLLALLNTGSNEFQTASHVARLAHETYGISYPEKTLPKDVLAALEAADYIKTQKATTGRGAKSHLCKPTKRAKVELLEPMIQQLEAQADPKLTQLLNQSLQNIWEQIHSTDTYLSGLALEALAFKLLRILGLDYMSTRLRAEATGGSEVDLLFHSSRLVYSRWQIQCKNAARVSLDQVAKEVGLTQLLYSNVIVIITTGKVSDDAQRYANHVMKNSNLNIIFVNGEDIQKIAKNPVAIIDIFEREAKSVMRLKKLDI